MDSEDDMAIARLERLVGDWAIRTIAFANIAVNEKAQEHPIGEVIEWEISKAETVANEISEQVYPGGYSIMPREFLVEYARRVIAHAHGVVEKRQ